MYPRALVALMAALTRLPGIGEKGAERLALHLARAPKDEARQLARAVARLPEEVTVCAWCRNLAEHDPCPLCADPARRRDLLCLVQSPADLTALEASGAYQGLYYVLAGALDPLKGLGPKQLHLEELAARIRQGGVTEVILGLSPTVEGEATGHLLAQSLAGMGLKVTRLGWGVPVGADLRYLDGLTLARSLEARRPLD
jgi:recombination protein RecR